MAFSADQIERFWMQELEHPTRHGHYLRACCPIHGGDNPNTLSVNLQTGFAHCFKCHGDKEGWSMIEFAMLRHGLSRQCAWDHVRYVAGSTPKPSIRPWQFPFARPTAITSSDWQLGMLAQRITQQLENTGKGWQATALYLYPEIQSVKIRLFDPATGEKRMVWFALTIKGGWSRPGKLGLEAPPYRSTTLKDAKEIWLLNGEKAVDRAIAAWGIVATCLPNGEGKWKEGYLRHFTGAAVVYLVLDNDASGEQHGKIVGGVLARAGVNARLVRLPGLAEKADCWDFIEAGGTLIEARAIAEAAPAAEATEEEEEKKKGATVREMPKRKPAAPSAPGEPPPKEPAAAIEGPDLTGYDKNDAGNARRLAAFTAGRLHYARHLEEPWLRYDQTRWKTGAVESTYGPARDALALLKEQANALDQDKLWKFADMKQNSGGLHAMIDLSKDLLAIDVNELDRHPYLVNCENGTFDLATDQLREHKASDFLTHVFPFAYDPTLGPPRLFLRTLDEWFGASADASEGELDKAAHMAEYLQRIMGYLLTGAVSEKAFFVFVGTGNNGKSTCISIMQFILGDYAVTISPATLTKGYGRNENNTNADVARTRGARAIFAAEPKEGEKFDQGLIKLLTQGETPITGVFKGKQPFSFLPTGKLILECNNVPTFETQDRPFLERMHLVRFPRQFDVNGLGKESLVAKLRREGAQIFNWAVEGARKVLLDGLQYPEEERAELKIVRDEQARNDGLEPFIEECLEIGAGLRCAVAEIEKEYRPWCERNRIRPWPRNRLSRQLCEREGISHGNDPKNHKDPAWLKGLALKTTRPQERDRYKDGTDDD